MSVVSRLHARGLQNTDPWTGQWTWPKRQCDRRVTARTGTCGMPAVRMQCVFEAFACQCAEGLLVEAQQSMIPRQALTWRSRKCACRQHCRIGLPPIPTHCPGIPAVGRVPQLAAGDPMTSCRCPSPRRTHATPVRRQSDTRKCPGVCCANPIRCAENTFLRRQRSHTSRRVSGSPSPPHTTLSNPECSDAVYENN